MKTYIIIKTQFEGIHHWPECPVEEVEFLKHPHRHIFHVTVKIEVNRSNRQIEFIYKKRDIDFFCRMRYPNNEVMTKSCEMIAEEILNKFDADYVSVFEDNENGAEVIK